MANLISGNGIAADADGILFDVDSANVAVASFGGDVTGNGGNGISINMNNVVDGAVEVLGDGSTSLISMNDQNGIEINLTNTDLTGYTNGVRTLSGLNLDGINVSRNNVDMGGFNGITINADNSDLTGGTINNITSQFNENGLVIDLINGSDWELDITNSSINANTVNGIHLTSDSNDTQSTININNNEFISNEDSNVVIDLNGTANAELHVDNNTLSGEGRAGVFTPGITFNSTFPFVGITPPDTVGTVGTNHIIHFTNTQYGVFDKNGNVLDTMTDEAFWTLAGVNLPTDTGDPRAIYDPATDRYFVVAFTTENTGNSILVAVSNTGNPLDGFTGHRFIGDIDDNLFVDFPMLGVDGNAVVITTNNFNAGGIFTDLSVFSIPKDDLVNGVGIVNLTRLENIPDVQIGATPQPVNDPGEVAAESQLLAADPFVNFPNFEYFLTTILDTETPVATQGATVTPVGTVADPRGNFAINPGGLFDSGADRIPSAILRVGDSIWASHGVQNTFGGIGVRWYEIDANTATVLQTGLIEDPNRDYIYPSIGVNNNGQVVIGFSGSSPTEFVGSYAVFGDTINGTTTFAAPTLLQPGFGSYTGFRWGDYSSTEADPVDPNKFWTFQEIATGGPTYATVITEINFDDTNRIDVVTLNDGINLNVSGDANVIDSTFNLNTITGNLGDAISINASDNANIIELDVLNNINTNNGSNVPVINNTSGGTVIINQ